MSGECVKAKFSKCSFGLAVGVTKGLYLLLLAWAGWLLGYGTVMIGNVSAVYYGYAPSLLGGILGGIYGFVDGFIFGFIAAYLYNFFLARCCKADSGESK